MSSERPVQIRYSEAFKRKVVSEIESGKYTQAEAMQIYGIKGSGTIRYWIKKSGKEELLSKKIWVETVDDTKRINELQKEIKQLKEALADSHLENILTKNLLKAADEHFGIDIKKNFGPKVSGEAEKN